MQIYREKRRNFIEFIEQRRRCDYRWPDKTCLETSARGAEDPRPVLRGGNLNQV